MRVTTVFRRVLGVSRTSVKGVAIEEKGLVVEVAPGNRHPRCGGCGKRAPGYDGVDVRDWRHLGLGSVRIWLRYAPRRVECGACGVRVERVPWASAGSLFTLPFEEMVASLEPRQGLMVPKGVLHSTRAQVRTVVLMFEAATIVP